MSANTARTTVAVIAAATVTVSVFSWFPEPEYKDYVRTGLACALSWFLYQGRDWARWLAAVLFALAGAFGIYAIATLRIDALNATPLIVVTVVYTGSAILLITGRIVGPHFDRDDN